MVNSSRNIHTFEILIGRGTASILLNGDSEKISAEKNRGPNRSAEHGDAEATCVTWYIYEIILRFTNGTRTYYELTSYTEYNIRHLRAARLPRKECKVRRECKPYSKMSCRDRVFPSFTDFIKFRIMRSKSM